MHLNFQSENDITAPYAEFVSVLREQGFQPYMNDRVTLMVAHQCPAVPNSGNCFFMARLGEWFLTTMGGWTYQLPAALSPVDLCLELLSFKETLRDVPEDLKARYGLLQLDASQRRDLEARIDQAESLLPSPVDFESFISEMTRRHMKVECSKTTPMCSVAGTVAGSRLWFILHANHWHVRTTAGVVYRCWDEQVIGLCIYALNHEPPILERFPDRFVQGYHMRELTTSEKLALMNYGEFPTE